MSDKVYVVGVGMVQQFKKDGQLQPAVTSADVNGDTVYRFTIKTNTNALVGISLWPELGHVAQHIAGGMGVIVEGQYTETQGQDGRKFHNVSAKNLVLLPSVQRQEREQVNPVAAQVVGAAETAAPAAAPAPAVAAGGSPF